MKSKIVLITGAAGGFGSETARRLAEMGHQLVLVDINQDGLEKLSASLPQPAFCIEADLTSLDEIQRIHSETMNQFGRLDILINNAGMQRNGPFEERTLESNEREMALNFHAPARLIHYFAPEMKKQKSGHIISISSLAGIVPLKECAMYSASKFALRGLMIALHGSLKEHGVKVTNICPSAFDTPMLVHEAQTGGSLLNFLGDPLPPSILVDAIIKAIDRNKIEICVPGSHGFLAKMGGSLPGLNDRLTPFFERSSQKYYERYLEKKGLTVPVE
ncbi:MAG: SDR family oxidoreductase [Chloroflexota bacterium]